MSAEVFPEPILVELALEAMDLSQAYRDLLIDTMRDWSHLWAERNQPDIAAFHHALGALVDRADKAQAQRLIVEATTHDVINPRSTAEATALLSTGLLDAIDALSRRRRLTIACAWSHM